MYVPTFWFDQIKKYYVFFILKVEKKLVNNKIGVKISLNKKIKKHSKYLTVSVQVLPFLEVLIFEVKKMYLKTKK